MNKRLLKIADIVGIVERIIDVGTDHGYLPVYLIENRQIQHAIVSDISKDSLNKAILLAKEKQLEDKIEARKGGGFHVLKKDDMVDVGIVAGMGGNLIAQILQENKTLLQQKNMRLILQPMQNPEVLRSYLIQNGYTIINEYLVQEERFIYQIIEVNVGVTSDIEAYSDLELEFGKKNACNEDERALYHELILSKKSKLQSIIDKVLASEAENKELIVEGYIKQIELIEENL